MNPEVYIAQIHIDPSVEDKIRRRAGGGCTGDEVREALVLRDDIEAWWEDDPEHGGLRLLAIGTTSTEREIFAVLLPWDPTDGFWILKTARPL